MGASKPAITHTLKTRVRCRYIRGIIEQRNIPTDCLIDSARSVGLTSSATSSHAPHRSVIGPVVFENPKRMLFGG